MNPRFLIRVLALCTATSALRAANAVRVPFPADYTTTFNAGAERDFAIRGRFPKLEGTPE